MKHQHGTGFDFGGALSPFFMDNEPGGDGGGGGPEGDTGGSTPPAFTPPDTNNPAVKAWLDRQVQERTSGLVKNRDEILAEKRRIEEEHKSFRSKFGDRDPDHVAKVFEQFQSEEERKLIAEGKFDEVFNRRAESLKQNHEKQVKSLSEKLDLTTKQATELTKKINELTIGRALTEAAVKAGVVPSAIEDLILRGKNVFSLNDKFEIQAVDANGVPRTAKDGVTPIDPETWIEGLKEVAPHYFPTSRGAGAGGSNPNVQQSGDVINVKLDGSMSQREFEAIQEKAEKEGKTINYI